MALTRKLTDLFVTGKDVVIEDGKGEPVTLYIRKITPLDVEEAYRAANAAKAMTLQKKTDPDDLSFQMIRQRCESMAKDEIVEQLSGLELEKKRLVIEAELEAEDRWAKDDYLQGLHDAWEGGLKKKHFTDPDEDTKRVYDEMQEFTAELEKRLEKEHATIKKDLSSLSAQKIRDRFFDEQFERQGEIAWITEYRRQELYFAVRDPDDHDVKAFRSPSEVEASERKLIDRLREEYASLAIDPLEGKG